eukprot:4630294-Pyramimonas_sp.AAC.1
MDRGFMGARSPTNLNLFLEGVVHEVRYVDTQSIRQQLNLNNVVVLSNLGYSSAGEVLNCHTYEVRPPTQTYRKR